MNVGHIRDCGVVTGAASSATAPGGRYAGVGDSGRRCNEGEGCVARTVCGRRTVPRTDPP
jgi:hypothetical protein